MRFMVNINKNLFFTIDCAKVSFSIPLYYIDNNTHMVLNRYFLSIKT